MNPSGSCTHVPTNYSRSYNIIIRIIEHMKSAGMLTCKRMPEVEYSLACSGAGDGWMHVEATRTMGQAWLLAVCCLSPDQLLLEWTLIGPSVSNRPKWEGGLVGRHCICPRFNFACLTTCTQYDRDLTLQIIPHDLSPQILIWLPANPTGAYYD